MINLITYWLSVAGLNVGFVGLAIFISWAKTKINIGD